MGATASQIASLTIDYSTVYSDADQRKHQSYASLAFVRGVHRGEFPAQTDSNAENVSISWRLHAWIPQKMWLMSVMKPVVRIKFWLKITKLYKILSFEIDWLHCFYLPFVSKVHVTINRKHNSKRLEDCQIDNFVVIGGIVSCHYGKLQCHQWQQNCRIDDLLFSVNCGKTKSRRYIHKWRPTFHPHGRTTGCLLLEFGKKLNLLLRYRTVLVVPWGKAKISLRELKTYNFKSQRHIPPLCKVAIYDPTDKKSLTH